MFIKNIPLPENVEVKELKNNKAEIIIEPCYPGYGVTLANALRRVLFSSLEGAAIIAFKVADVQHEFSTIPYVKEDLVDIILNLKQLRLKVFSNEEIRLELSVKGEKVITAGDITPNSEVEITNKDLVICTATDKKCNLNMEIIVSKGRGYVTVESKDKEKLEIGMIAVDSLYSPVINDGFEIENVRVGQKTDYEKIILNIETDGTIKPKDALKEAAKILVDQFQQILEPQELAKEIKEEIKPTDLPEPEIVYKHEEKDEPVTKKKRGRPKKDT